MMASQDIDNAPPIPISEICSGMSSLYYAGIGSRRTPMSVLVLFKALACRLGEKGWTLRSGGAPGADQAFESGLCPWHPREIFLPWKGFEKNPSTLYPASKEAYEMASKFHPKWSSLSDVAKAFHARNCHQVLGINLDKPVEMIICYTEGGSGSGGTGQAIRIAKSMKIPIFDFGRSEAADELRHYMKGRLV